MKKYIISKKEYDEVVEAMNTLTSENQKLHGFIEGMRERLILSGVSQQRELLPDFLYEDDGIIKVGVHGDSDVTDEWNDYLKKNR